MAIDRMSPVHMLDRSLAFTALLELSPEFAEGTDRDGTAVTRLLDEYYEWLDAELARGGLFRAGVHDIYTYARTWLAQGGMDKEA